MHVQTIYWQDFTLDFRDIRWTFGRVWDWANFREVWQLCNYIPHQQHLAEGFLKYTDI